MAFTREELLALQERLNTGKNMSVPPEPEVKEPSSIPLFNNAPVVSPESQANYKAENEAQIASGKTIPLGEMFKNMIASTPLGQSAGYKSSTPAASNIPSVEITPAEDSAVDVSQLATAPSALDTQVAERKVREQSASNRFGAIEETFNTEQQALQDQSKALMDSTDATSKLQMKLYEDQKAIEARDMQSQVDNQAKLTERMDNLNNKLLELDKVTIDRNKFWDDKTTTNKIVTGIGLFLGAFGQGGNRAAEMVERAITQDINSQISNLNNKKTNTAQQMNIVQQMSQVFKSEGEVKAASRVFAYNNAMIQLQATANMYKSPEIAAKTKAGMAQLERAKQIAMVQFENAAKTSIASQSSDPITASIYKLPKETHKDLIEAKEVYESTNAALKSIDESYAATADIGIGGKVPFSDSKAIVNAENAKIESAIRSTMKGQGTIQEAEIQRLVNPFLIATLDTASQRLIKKEKLKELLLTKNAGQINKLQAFGLIPKKQEFKTLKPNK